MRSSANERGAAVFGSGIGVLIHAYYLQRFGFKVDVFVDDMDFPRFTTNELISTWLGLHQSSQAARTDWQGIAELRDMALDLGSKVIASSSGTLIFERRPEYVGALEQFASNCKANGLLVEFSTRVAHLDVPPCTLAVAKFDQDVSIVPKRLAQLLIESIQHRGASIFRGRTVNELRLVGTHHEIGVNDETLRYTSVVVCNDAEKVEQGDALNEAGDAGLTVRGRYLSFERASHILAMTKPSSASQLASVIIDPIRGLFSKDASRRRALWPSIEHHYRDPEVFTVASHLSVFHYIAGARELAELMRSRAGLFQIDALTHTDPTWQALPQSIPWII
ncbi:MAG: FAD-dependent oxidoreductase [Pseudomonas sp.]|uniref:FAD-dependent oxidoreductase n=1 Tax=Pseudomonas sp. TaxID=306 RepID=UPI003D6F5032